MTTSQRELLLLLAKTVADTLPQFGDARKKIAELMLEINAGSQELR